MKALRIILAGIILYGISNDSYSQTTDIQDATIYKTELFGSAATGSIRRSGWLATVTALFRKRQATVC